MKSEKHNMKKEEITRARNWLENELKEEKEKLAIDKAD
jgi:hypothetical protein